MQIPQKIRALSEQKEDHLRLVIDTIPTMAWRLLPDGAVDFVNQRWLEYTGLTLEEALEEPQRIVHPEDLPRAVEKWLPKMAAGDPAEDEMRFRRADGEYRWFLIRVVPLRDNQGNIVNWYGTSTDIEDRKRAEDAQRASEALLRQAIEDRERAARDLHDGLMQEIYAVGLGLEEAQRNAGSDPDAVRRRIDVAIEQLNKVLRDVRHHIVGNAPPSMSAAQLRDELEALMEMLKGLHPLRISLDLDPAALFHLSSSSTHDILNIVREAVSNTLRHARARTAHVFLRDEGSRVRLGIEDDGKGFGVEEALTRGNGLRNIAMRARQLVARLDVRSSPGHGTTIVVEIPASAVA